MWARKRRNARQKVSFKWKKLILDLHRIGTYLIYATLSEARTVQDVYFVGQVRVQSLERRQPGGKRCGYSMYQDIYEHPPYLLP